MTNTKTIIKAEQQTSQKQEKNSKTHYSITFNNTNYVLKENSEHFYINGDINSEKLTALEVMTREFKETKADYKRLDKAHDKFFNFADTTRRKIIRMVQLHNNKPKITLEIMAFTPFFYAVSNNFDGKVKREFTAARFAANWNDEQAAALLLYCGWCPQIEPLNMRGSSMHSLTATNNGILVDMTYTHTFQERLTAACNSIKDMLDNYNETSKKKKRKEPPPDLLAAGMKVFYYYSNKCISITTEYKKTVETALKEYIKSLTNSPQIPIITEPDNILNDDIFLLSWDDFILTNDLSSKQLEQRNNNGSVNSLKALQSSLKGLSRDKEYTKKELLQYINYKNLSSGERYGFLILVNDGLYKINFKDDTKYIIKTLQDVENFMT